MMIEFDAGTRRDPKGKEGLAELTARCLSQGTKELTAPEFDQKVDFMGSSVGVSAGRDYSTAGMTSLKKYQGETLQLLAGILTEPGLRDADIERKRAEQVAEIKAAEEQPGYTADVEFTKDLFGDSPYGHPGAGSSDSVAKLTNDDVRGFYHDYYKLGSAIIAVAGDVTADEVKASLEKSLAGLAGTVAPQAAPPPINVPPGLHVKLIDRNVMQANIIMGSGGVERSNPDFYRLKVMNYILGGGGFSSRLVKVVRSEHGLAYSINSGFEPGKFQGAFTIGLQTKNAELERGDRFGPAAASRDPGKAGQRRRAGRREKISHRQLPVGARAAERDRVVHDPGRVLRTGARLRGSVSEADRIGHQG